MGKTGKGAISATTIGNGLMAASVVVALVIFYPVIKEELTYRITKITASSAPVSADFSIRIPVLSINAPVVEGVDPWNEREYRAALQKGVAHAKGSAFPGETGTVYLFSHSSDLPWRMTRYNTAFFRLGRVREGDQIIVTYKGKDIIYRIREKKTVWPNEVQYLTSQDRDQLILQTCTPIGTALKRLLVFAEREENFLTQISKSRID